MYVDYIKMLMNFENGLYDTVSGITFNAENLQEDLSVSYSENGYIMQAEQYLIGRDIPVDFTSSGFSLTFWLYPNNPGQVQSPITGEVISLRKPVVVFLKTFVDIDKPILSIYENTNVDGTNELELSIFSYDEFGVLQTVYSCYSDSYTEKENHHFFFNFSIEKEEVSIFIDGEESLLNEETGSLPSDFNYSLIDVSINKVYESNFDYNLAYNDGVIADIGLFNMEFDAKTILYFLINKGIKSFIDLSLKDKDEFYQTFLFDDPTTLKINAMVDDMSFVYLARNDGRILAGSPLLWEARKNYSNSKELLLLDEFIISNSDTATPAQINNGFLEIKDSIIRL